MSWIKCFFIWETDRKVRAKIKGITRSSGISSTQEDYKRSDRGPAVGPVHWISAGEIFLANEETGDSGVYARYLKRKGLGHKAYRHIA